MPGNIGGEYIWRYLTDPAVYRTIVAADTDSVATVEALPTYIDLTKMDSAYHNILNLFCYSDAAITKYNVKVYINAHVGALGRWVRIYRALGVEEPALLTIPDIPNSYVKIISTSWTGAGSIVIEEQHSRNNL